MIRSKFLKNFNVSGISLNPLLFLVPFALLLGGCNLQKSGLNSRGTGASLIAETTVTLNAEEIIVRLTPSDSSRLAKALERPTIQPVPAPGAQKSVLEFGKDITFECVSSSEAPVSKNCTVSINHKPVSSENFVSSDPETNEHMFQLRRAEDAKRLYSTMNVKEWDLQGSLYKRFASSDNRMILECILDAERSRCSVFLSDGRSDDLSD